MNFRGTCFCETPVIIRTPACTHPSLHPTIPQLEEPPIYGTAAVVPSGRQRHTLAKVEAHFTAQCV
ncbi:hypothetical protein CEXT_563291, partial [Caerostris extrusa]